MKPRLYGKKRKFGLQWIFGAIENLSSELVNAKDNDGDPVVDRSVASGAAPTALIVTTPLNENTTHISWSLETSAIYVTFDGSDPVDGSNGHRINVGASDLWPVELAKTVRLIQGDAVAGRIHISEMMPR